MKSISIIQRRRGSTTCVWDLRLTVMERKCHCTVCFIRTKHEKEIKHREKLQDIMV